VTIPGDGIDPTVNVWSGSLGRIEQRSHGFNRSGLPVTRGLVADDCALGAYERREAAW
jgi:hypothetical protein